MLPSIKFALARLGGRVVSRVLLWSLGLGESRDGTDGVQSAKNDSGVFCDVLTYRHPERVAVAAT